MEAAINPYYNDKLNPLIDKLAEQERVIEPDFFEPELINALYLELQQRQASDRLNQARIGKGDQQTRIESIRGDAIHWLNGETAAQQQFMAIMNEYMLRLNQQLFLGLNELEAHFAHYPAGMGYQKHVDSFQNNNLRRITIVVYLNPEWDEKDGGELELFEDDKVVQKVVPHGGTLVSFISEDLAHQVAITHKERFSIAGWFRVRDNKLI